MEWTDGLCCSGLYYEGFVTQISLKKMTGTTYETRNSSMPGNNKSIGTIEEEDEEKSHLPAEAPKIKITDTKVT